MTFPYNPVTARLEALAACLCAQIEDPENGVPGVCFCGVVPGAAIPAEYSGDCNNACGAAWVRLVTVYPSNQVGAALITPGNCAHGLGMDAEVGILRCTPVGDEQGNPPTQAELLDSTELQIADAILMLKAIECCEALNINDLIVGQYQPIGPEGGLVGGVYTLSLAVT